MYAVAMDIYIDLLDVAGWDEEMRDCETCGHFSKEVFEVWTSDDGEVMVAYTSEASCYNWYDWSGTLEHDFPEWFASEAPKYIGPEGMRAIEEALEL